MINSELLLQSATFSMKCGGRNEIGEGVLKRRISISTTFRILEDNKTISISVKCPYNKGSHSELCGASSRALRSGAFCPYTNTLS